MSAPISLDALALKHHVTVAELLATGAPSSSARVRSAEGRREVVQAAASRSLTAADVCALTGWTLATVSQVAQRAGVRLRAGAGAPPLPKPRRLPLVQGYMVPGSGPRAGDGAHPLADCRRYDACLDAPARALGGGGDAHCPVACRWWEAVARSVRATSYVSLNGEARGAA